jgi:hypothetical protein
LVLQQAELRRRGREKFAVANRMFFTPVGLEQATDESIANYKASRFASHFRTTQEPLADLCCGIGGDLIALARYGGMGGPVVGVDRDPVAVLFAEANLVAMGDPAVPGRTHVSCSEVADFPLAAFRAWHIDPDRRLTGRRTTQVQFSDPAPDAIHRLLAECPSAAVKLAPAAELSEGWTSRAELEWITSRRECRQLVAWFGELAIAPGSRRATILTAGETARLPGKRTFVGQPNLAIPRARQIGPYVFDPDPSILASGLCGALAAEHGLAAISPRVAYLTGTPSSEKLYDAALASFEVLEVLPMRIKTLRSWLCEHGIGRLEVKKRGVDIDPNRLAAELKSEGDKAATILIMPQEDRAIAIIARRDGRTPDTAGGQI